jgi:hypothetical protein
MAWFPDSDGAKSLFVGWPPSDKDEDGQYNNRHYDKEEKVFPTQASHPL